MVGRDDELSAEFEDAAVFRILLDDLHALSCLLEPPILFMCVRVELAKRSEPLLVRLQNLPYEISFEREVVPAHRQQREEVFRIDGAEEIEIRPMFEKLRRKARIGAEEQ